MSTIENGTRGSDHEKASKAPLTIASSTLHHHSIPGRQPLGASSIALLGGSTMGPTFRFDPIRPTSLQGTSKQQKRKLAKEDASFVPKRHMLGGVRLQVEPSIVLQTSTSDQVSALPTCAVSPKRPRRAATLKRPKKWDDLPREQVRAIEDVDEMGRAKVNKVYKSRGRSRGVGRWSKREPMYFRNSDDDFSWYSSSSDEEERRTREREAEKKQPEFDEKIRQVMRNWMKDCSLQRMGQEVFPSTAKPVSQRICLPEPNSVHHVPVKERTGDDALRGVIRSSAENLADFLADTFDDDDSDDGYVDPSEPFTLQHPSFRFSQYDPAAVTNAIRLRAVTLSRMTSFESFANLDARPSWWQDVFSDLPPLQNEEQRPDTPEWDDTMKEDDAAVADVASSLSARLTLTSPDESADQTERTSVPPSEYLDTDMIDLCDSDEEILIKPKFVKSFNNMTYREQVESYFFLQQTLLRKAEREGAKVAKGRPGSGSTNAQAVGERPCVIDIDDDDDDEVGTSRVDAVQASTSSPRQINLQAPEAAVAASVVEHVPAHVQDQRDDHSTDLDRSISGLNRMHINAPERSPSQFDAQPIIVLYDGQCEGDLNSPAAASFTSSTTTLRDDDDDDSYECLAPEREQLPAAANQSISSSSSQSHSAIITTPAHRPKTPQPDPPSLDSSNLSPIVRVGSFRGRKADHQRKR